VKKVVGYATEDDNDEVHVAVSPGSTRNSSSSCWRRTVDTLVVMHEFFDGREHAMAIGVKKPKMYAEPKNL
jgi:predicted transcriptional regulator